MRQSPPVTVAAGSVGVPATPDPAAAPTSNSPLRLTDDQLAAVFRAAQPLAVGDRALFLQDVATALQGRLIGDGMLHRVIAQVQRRYFDAPIMSTPPRWAR
jgi:hypothetical protein